VNLYFQDESRFGLYTKPSKGLTAKGADQRICSFQQVFQSCYLFGAFSPVNGHHFELEMRYSNADTFRAFLNKFSVCRADEYKIIVLDNGAFHKAKHCRFHLIYLFLFLPPYTPKFNPAEKNGTALKEVYQQDL